MAGEYFSQTFDTFKISFASEAVFTQKSRQRGWTPFDLQQGRTSSKLRKHIIPVVHGNYVHMLFEAHNDHQTINQISFLFLTHCHALELSHCFVRIVADFFHGAIVIKPASSEMRNIIIDQRGTLHFRITDTLFYSIYIISPTFDCKKYWRQCNSFPSSVSSRLESMWHWLAPLRVFDVLPNPWSFSLSSGKLWIAAHV